VTTIVAVCLISGREVREGKREYIWITDGFVGGMKTKCLPEGETRRDVGNDEEEEEGEGNVVLLGSWDVCGILSTGMISL
jgi:hypothetical protein